MIGVTIALAFGLAVCAAESCERDARFPMMHKYPRLGGWLMVWLYALLGAGAEAVSRMIYGAFQ